MGDMSYGFLSAYGSVGRYSRLAVLLLMLLGVFSGFGFAADNCGTVTSPACHAASTVCDQACPVATAYGCVGDQVSCVTSEQAVMFPLCGVYNTVHNVIFLLGVVLVILGGTLYAGANIMPSQSKGQIQGYGMGFILGGVVGVVIAILAPYIIGIVSGHSGSSIVSVCQT